MRVFRILVYSQLIFSTQMRSLVLRNGNQHIEANSVLSLHIYWLSTLQILLDYCHTRKQESAEQLKRSAKIGCVDTLSEDM